MTYSMPVVFMTPQTRPALACTSQAQLIQEALVRHHFPTIMGKPVLSCKAGKETACVYERVKKVNLRIPMTLIKVTLSIFLIPFQGEMQ